MLGSQIKYCLFWDLSSPLRPLETNTWRSLFELEILGLWLLSSFLIVACGGRMLMKSSSSLLTTFYDITCKGFWITLWFDEFSKNFEKTFLTNFVSFLEDQSDLKKGKGGIDVYLDFWPWKSETLLLFFLW